MWRNKWIYIAVVGSVVIVYIATRPIAWRIFWCVVAILRQHK